MAREGPPSDRGEESRPKGKNSSFPLPLRRSLGRTRRSGLRGVSSPPSLLGRSGNRHSSPCLRACPSRGYNLSLVLGPNEAGKSSALRALRALLYGVPERTQDDFRHGKTELRVGGRLRGAAGSELHCYRRKGRKNTLLDANGDPVAEDRLAGLLGGVAEPLFERLSGIDHEALETAVEEASRLREKAAAGDELGAKVDALARIREAQRRNPSGGT